MQPFAVAGGNVSFVQVGVNDGGQASELPGVDQIIKHRGGEGGGEFAAEVVENQQLAVEHRVKVILIFGAAL